jgi:uncharacterized membrane protein
MAQRDSTSGAFSVVLPTLAALLFLAALIALVTGLSLLFPGPGWIAMWNLNRPAYDSFHRLGWIAEAFLLSLSVIAASAAVGLLLHKKWAWCIAVILFVVNGAGDLISVIRTHDVLRFGSGVLIAGGFVFLLMLQPVRRTVR